MPRPRKHRHCRRYRADRVFKPQGIPMREVEKSLLSLDQFEALRLCDLENLDQAEAGQRMGVSRGTVQRLLYSARQQVVAALLDNHAIIVNLQPADADAETCERTKETDNARMHSHQRQCRSGRHGK